VFNCHEFTPALLRVPARAVAVAGLALAAAGYGTAALWTAPAHSVTGMSVAALGIGCCFVTAFTASLANAPAAVGGLRGAIVNTFHERRRGRGSGPFHGGGRGDGGGPPRRRYPAAASSSAAAAARAATEDDESRSIRADREAPS
jgi:hypothetical protein